MVTTYQLVLELVLLVALPATVGPVLAHWIGVRAKRRGSTPARVRGLRILASVVWVSILVVGLSVTLGSYNFLSTLTFSAIAGIAVTLALQTTLQNFVSGLLLLHHGALRVGDSILFSGAKGTVVDLGLVSTVVRLDDGTLAFVSNSNLLSGPLINYTAAKRFSGEY